MPERSKLDWDTVREVAAKIAQVNELVDIRASLAQGGTQQKKVDKAIDALLDDLLLDLQVSDQDNK